MSEHQEPEKRRIDMGDGNYIESIGGNYVQGNFIQNSINYLGGQSIPPVGNSQRERNQRLLLAQVKNEVTARLKQSLHEAVFLELGKESQPEQVKRPWDVEVKIGVKTPKPIPDTTKIIDVFTYPEIVGKLLILGAPGSGKTTTQLELAEVLIRQAEEQPDYPIPVLLNLSSWQDERQSITDWLIVELKSKYGVSKSLGLEWLQNRYILPLLDGLDEVKQDRQEPCIKSINQFLQGVSSPQYLVVCSRREEYSNHSTKLLLNGAIYLKPLTNNQIRDYLNEVNCIDLQISIENDLNLLELIKTPLLLNIAILAFQEISIEGWQQLSSTSDRIQHLLNAYVSRMLNRDIESKTYVNKKSPHARQTRMWLIWLAHQLQRESQTEFLIEKIQPSWLLSKVQIFNYLLILGIVQGIIIFPLYLLYCSFSKGTINLLLESVIFFLFFCVFLLMVGLIRSEMKRILALMLLIGLFYDTVMIVTSLHSNHLLYKLVYGIIVGIILGFLGGRNSNFLKKFEQWLFEIKIFEKLKFSLKKYFKFSWLDFRGIAGFLIFIILLWFFVSKAKSLMMLLLFFIFLIIFRIPRGLEPVEIEMKIKPNQGIWMSLKKSVIYGVFYTLFFLLFITFAECILFGINFSILCFALIFGLLFGLYIGLGTGLLLGGHTCIQHFLVRLILYFNGYIPWNFARFLDYCTERSFLQRVGGRYRFIHKTLQEHFANMDFKRP